MIAIYTGGMVRIPIETIVGRYELRKDVPTWLPEHAREAVEKQDDCDKWRSEPIEIGENKIFVGFSNDLHAFAAAQYALAKIRAGFPSCQIETTCRPDFAALLPSWVTRLNYREARTDYYRLYFLTKEYVPNNNDPWIETLIRWQRIAMIGGGLFEPGTDNPDQGDTFPGAKSEPGNVVIVDKGDLPDCTIPGASEIASQLESKLSKSGEVVRIAEYNRRDLSEQIDQIRHAETTIHLGYTHLAYLSAALGIRTLMIRKIGFTKDVWPNFEHFKNAEVIKTAGASGPAEIAEIILGMVGNPALAKASRHVSKLADSFGKAADAAKDMDESAKRVAKAIDDAAPPTRPRRRGPRAK